MAASKYIYACRHGQDNLLKFKLSIWMEKKSDSSDFECGMVVGLSTSETAGISPHNHL